MFNRRILILVACLSLAIGALWWYWRSPVGLSLQTGQSVISATRYTQKLNGNWDLFSSVRQAWTTESERAQGKNDQSFLTRGRPVTLPSSERVMVVAKRFRVPGEWSSRTMLLTFNGVQGQATVYLNGIASSQKIGEFEGSGGADGIEVPAQLFRYGGDNILVVELSSSAGQRATLLGSVWPKSGCLTGDIQLEAVVETTLQRPQMNVTWNETTALITVKTNLWHHGFSKEGPWTVYGVLSDGSAGIAEQTLTVAAQQSSDQQPVSMTFAVPNARRWTTQAPFLYQLHLTVTNSNGDVDDLAMPLGLRSLALTSGKWVLNDQVISIKGEALTPQESFQYRNAGQLDSWLKSEQQKGINLIYFIGQVPDDLWLEAADRVGMGLWAELPVELVPSRRLPRVDFFNKMIGEKMLHPSLWAWTVGKGLDSDVLAQTFSRQSANQVQPDLAFALKMIPSASSGLAPEQTLHIQGDKIQGSWGQVTVKTSSDTSVRWVKEPLLAGIWALLMCFIAGMTIRSVTWRYKEIGEKRPKRRLRKAWFWEGMFVIAREGMLAGLITSGLFRIPIHFSPWFSHLWPGIQLIQSQSPWLIWTTLGVVFLLVRMIQVSLAVPHMPNAPHAVGLIYWLERRYHFAVVIAIAWALMPLGVPFYIPILGYLILALVLLPIRIRDIHRIGGHYLPFLWVPGIITAVLFVLVAIYNADWLFLWHMLSL